MDVDRVAACATTAEARAARRAGYRTALVGLGVRRGAPAGELVSFGVCGGLNGLEIGALIDATRVVDEEGRVLWEGSGLGIAGARPATILAIDRLVDDPVERRQLHERTGADAVDMESGVLALTGRLRGAVRAISDTPEQPLGTLAKAVSPAGRPRLGVVVRAVVQEPRKTLRALLGIRSALSALSGATAPTNHFPTGREGNG